MAMMWKLVRCINRDYLEDDLYNFEIGELYEADIEYYSVKSWSGTVYYYYPIEEWFEEYNPTKTELFIRKLKMFLKWKEKKKKKK